MNYFRRWLKNCGIIVSGVVCGMAILAVAMFGLHWLVVNVSPVLAVIVAISVIIGTLSAIITPKD